MLDSRFVFLGAALNFYGAITYAISTVRGHVKPNRVSWLLWALAPLIAFLAEIVQGVGIQSFMTLAIALGSALVFLLSFGNRHAYWEITRFDLLCGSLSLLALILWYVTKTGNIAIIFSILADGLATAPTAVKAYLHPATEHYGAYLFCALNGAITLSTIRIWHFDYYAFPLYIFVVFSLIFVLVKFPLLRFGKLPI
jgi:hypothetical protein